MIEIMYSSLKFFQTMSNLEDERCAKNGISVFHLENTPFVNLDRVTAAAAGTTKRTLKLLFHSDICLSLVLHAWLD